MQGLCSRLGKGLLAVFAALLLSSGVVNGPAAQAVDVAPNPPLTSQCGQTGVKVAFVVDLSGSMGMGPVDGVYPLTKLKTAATAYINALRGTDSSVALFTFSSTSPANNTNNANRPLTSLKTDADANQVISWINGWTALGLTRWDEGLKRVVESGITYDFVIFITDGSPTNHSYIAPANSIKEKGTRIFAVYAGTKEISSTQRQNLSQLSGPIYQDPSPAKNDYFASNWSEMEALLKDLSTLCQGADVSVVYVDDNAGGAVVTPVSGTPTTLTGTEGDPVGFTEADARAGVPTGYEFVRMEGAEWFTSEPQTMTVHLAHGRTIGSLTTTRTITYVGAGDRTPAPVTQSVTWITSTDQVTGAVTYTTDSAGFPAQPSPFVAGHTVDIAHVPVLPVESPTMIQPQSTTVTVTYTPVAGGETQIPPVAVKTGGAVRG